MRNLITILALASFISCGKNDTSLSGVNVDKTAILSIVNSTGTDLLDPSLESSYKEGDITIYYEINGVVQKVQGSTEAIPGTTSTTFNSKGFSIVRYANQNLYMMNVELNLDGLNRNTDKYTNTYIEWPNHDVDTLKTLFHKYDDKGIWYTEFWYNGVELRKKAVEAFNLNENTNKILHYSIEK